MIPLDKKNKLFPWRICLLGGWMDQPFVSKIYPGSVIVVNVDYHENFVYKSGLATSSREVGIKICNGIKNNVTHLDNLEMARIMFGVENPPGTKNISGSQDHLGLMLPGISKLDYDGKYWPYNIEQILHQDKIFRWLEKILWIVPGKIRKDNYEAIINKNYLGDYYVNLLSKSSKIGWNAIKTMNAKMLGKAMRLTNEAWCNLFPNTVPSDCEWEKYDKICYGVSVTHGGGYIMCISDKKIKNAFQIKICSKEWLQNSEKLRPI